MSCVLRAGGERFCVDRFIASASLRVDSVWRRGEQRFRGGSAKAGLSPSSGVRIRGSNAGFDEFEQQVEEAIAFLHRNLADVQRLSAFPGVEWSELDFGVEIYPPGWASFTFPPELLSLSAQAGVSRCVSVYPGELEADEGGESVLQKP